MSIGQETRERLIEVAKSLFAEKGYEGTTVKDLAEAAGVNISLVSYHFSGKEGLYRACLEQFGMARLASTQKILQPPHSFEELKIRFQMFVEEFYNTFLEEPEVSQIVTRECDMEFPIARDLFRDTFLKVYETLVHFLKFSQSQGFIRQDADVEITAKLIFGGIVHVAQKDKVNEMFYGKTIRDKSYRDQIIQHSISFWLAGYVSPTHSKDASYLHDRGLINPTPFK